MQTGIFRFLLNVLQERGGALLGLARKGLDTIRSLLGSARGLLGPLVKRAISWVMSKVSPVVTGARDKLSDALASLKRRAEVVMRGDAPPESEIEEPETPIEPAAEVPRGEAAAVHGAESANETPAEPAPAFRAEATDENAGDETAGEALVLSPRLAHASGDGPAKGADLAALAPAIGRALMRALSRNRVPRTDPPTFSSSS